MRKSEKGIGMGTVNRLHKIDAVLEQKQEKTFLAAYQFFLKCFIIGQVKLTPPAAVQAASIFQINRFFPKLLLRQLNNLT